MNKKGKASDYDRHIGEQLRLIRNFRRLTQQELAAEIGVTFQQLQKYERGVNRISAGRLFQFSRALNVSPQSFFDGL